MILVMGSFRLPPRSIGAAQIAMARVVEGSRAEAGCIDYAYAEDVLEPGLFRVSEAWTDRAALDAHFHTPHMQAWLAERADFGITDRRVTAYEVSGEEAL
jgi:quinol monooxygenase YgiN